jgi:plasmid stabilization system protein ParE
MLADKAGRVANRIAYSPEASADLTEIYDFIADRGSPMAALRFVERIAAACDALGTLPGRGSPRDDIRPGLRVTGFARRVTIAYHLDGETVIIDRLLYAGRDLGAAFSGL